MTKNKKFILGIGISDLTKKQVLEEIKKGLKVRGGFFQIFTVNPEILVLAQKNESFKKLINKAQIATADGVGVLLAGKILGQPFKERVTGVELMKSMVKMADNFGLSVGLIGGRGDLAVKTAECLKKKHQNLKIFGLEGFKDVKKQTLAEKSLIISIIRDRKPQMLFVAFGAPCQEFLIEWLRHATRNKQQATSNKQHAIIAMGVGGSFAEISGQVKRVPKWLDKLGLKWLWRLLCQPWRWRRQLALIEFIWLVLKEKFKFVKR